MCCYICLAKCGVHTITLRVTRVRGVRKEGLHTHIALTAQHCPKTVCVLGFLRVPLWSFRAASLSSSPNLSFSLIQQSQDNTQAPLPCVLHMLSILMEVLFLVLRSLKSQFSGFWEQKGGTWARLVVICQTFIFQLILLALKTHFEWHWYGLKGWRRTFPPGSPIGVQLHLIDILKEHCPAHNTTNYLTLWARSCSVQTLK